MPMLISAFFSWWYGAGWTQVLESFVSRQKGILALFSVNQLAQTMFAPWRRIITYPGAGLNERLHAIGDNLVSRVIGFIVRLLVLLTAGVTMLVVALLTTIELFIWPLAPLAVPGLIILGFVL